MRVAVIGAGSLGTSLIRNASRRAEVIAIRRRKELIPEMENVFPASEIEEAENCDVFLITLKPDVFRENMKKIGEICGEKPVISFAAGVKIQEMRKFIKNPSRAMTNPAIERRTLVAVYPPSSSEHLKFLDADFIFCETEKELDAMTSFIGSSPAVISKLIHAFIISALHEGISYRNALKTALSAFESATYLSSRYTLEEIIEKTATPGGTTVEGLLEVIEAERKFADALIEMSRKVERLSSLGRP
ncbi:MAG: NAD(P)-binding domain-containing protein [Archaeoglobi archaeon]|nr:NAD(P)-binding domain-containing protein [Candidatus Mnemosynella sp.]MBC7115135.1 NAD(P)-binding domain-containing protein [Candidatus Mnemosynella bozhongmuii]